MEVIIMKRETKINILIAALAELIAQDRVGKEEYKLAPQITFLSKTEVRFDEFPEIGRASCRERV